MPTQNESQVEDVSNIKEFVYELISGLSQDIESEFFKSGNHESLQVEWQKFRYSRDLLKSAVEELGTQANPEDSFKLLTAYSVFQTYLQTIFGSTPAPTPAPLTGVLGTVLQRLKKLGAWIWQLISMLQTPKEWSAKFSITPAPFIPHLGSVELQITFTNTALPLPPAGNPGGNTAASNP